MPSSEEFDTTASTDVIDNGRPCRRRLPPALFHIGYQLPGDEGVLRQKFKHVKFVLLCGSQSRAALIATTFALLCQSNGRISLGNPRNGHEPSFPNICTSGRYAVFQPHAGLLAVSHGIGSGSADIMFHEITSLLRVAGATEYAYIRLGSCGGCGVDCGQLVVSEEVVNGAFEPFQRTIVLGKEVTHGGKIDLSIAKELQQIAENLYGKESVKTGKTMCCESFYEGQARLDGAIAAYSEDDRTRFLHTCHDFGILNFEMESLPLAAFCARARIPCAVVCAALVNRLNEDGIDSPNAADNLIKDWESRPVQVAAQYVYKKLVRDKA